MIPDFNDEGYLPPGLYPASLKEIIERFGQESEIRRVQSQSLEWLVELAMQAGVLRIAVNGSFVTDKYEPNDVDCALLVGADYPRNVKAATDLLKGLPFISLAIVDEVDFRRFIEHTFATDRDMIPKGLIEVIP